MNGIIHKVSLSVGLAAPASTMLGPNTTAQGSATVAVVVVVIIAAVLATVIGIVMIPLIVYRKRARRSRTAVLYTKYGKYIL